MSREISFDSPPSTGLLVGRVLLVEPHRLTASIQKAALESRGLGVRWVSDGEEALRLCFDMAIDVMVLELELPLLHGARVLRRLGAAGQDISSVVVTSLSPAIEGEVRALGADDFFTKPFDPEAVADCARAVVEGQRQRRAQ